jgi:hypothetical protein
MMNVVPNWMARPSYVDYLGFRQTSSPSDQGDFGPNRMRSYCLHPTDNQSNPVSIFLYGANGSYYLI